MPLPGKYGSPEFMAGYQLAYHDAFGGLAPMLAVISKTIRRPDPNSEGSIDWLVSQYLVSDMFAGYSKKSTARALSHAGTLSRRTWGQAAVRHRAATYYRDNRSSRRRCGSEAQLVEADQAAKGSEIRRLSHMDGLRLRNIAGSIDTAPFRASSWNWPWRHQRGVVTLRVSARSRCEWPV